MKNGRVYWPCEETAMDNLVIANLLQQRSSREANRAAGEYVYYASHSRRGRLPLVPAGWLALVAAFVVILAR